MADPLSIAASVTALLQLTQSVGQHLSAARTASTERSSLRNEVIYLTGLLVSLKDCVTRGTIWSAILSSLVGPKGPLGLLHEALQQLATKLNAGKGKASATETFKWIIRKDEVEAILKRIERQKMLILLVMENIHIYEALLVEMGAVTNR